MSPAIMRRIAISMVVVGLVFTACGGSSESEDKPNSGGSGGKAASGGVGGGVGGIGVGGSGGSAALGGSGGAVAGGGAGIDGGGIGGATGGAAGASGATSKLCLTDPPAGATLAAAPKPYSGGACPTLVAGSNTITSSGATRSFLLALPKDLAAGERLPVVFMWHWLGGSASSFYEKGDVQNAVDTQRFAAVLPEAKGDLLLKWPYAVSDSDARMAEEFAFFDDMLACVSAELNVEPNCVSTVGVSAGALFSAQLASYRGDHLASFISLSGGVGGVIRPWGNPEHRMPAIVLWGGPNDQCYYVMNFQVASQNLENALTNRGHFMIECIHNCGHAEPPFDPPPGMSTYAALWDFVFAHPFWMAAGSSPYNASGLPSYFPTWCAIGKGNATPRTGDCPNSPGC